MINNTHNPINLIAKKKIELIKKSSNLPIFERRIGNRNFDNEIRGII